jgi:hypothetical protein
VPQVLRKSEIEVFLIVDILSLPVLILYIVMEQMRGFQSLILESDTIAGSKSWRQMDALHGRVQKIMDISLAHCGVKLQDFNNQHTINMNKKIKALILLSSAFALIISLSDITSSWTAPTTGAPAGDTNPPINEGSSAQRKSGSLGVQGLASFGGATFTGKVQIKNGTQGAGKILVTDGVGNTRWVTPPKYATRGTVACPQGTTIMPSGECGYEYKLMTGGLLYCTGTDELVSIRDACSGECRNHGLYRVEPNGCYTWEGEDNYGGQACELTCRGAVRMCMRIVNGDADWYLSGADKKCN